MDRFSETFAPHGFESKVFHPGFGMAEATLVITGGYFDAEPVVKSVSDNAMKSDLVVPPIGDEKTRNIVGCGLALPGECVAIVNPETAERLPVGRVGEVWVNGPHTGQGYWRNLEATVDTFEAKIVDEDERHWLRTGDLGCMDENGELYITGRLKDVIIVRGENYYPQDIEFSAEQAHSALRRGCSAAFVQQEGSQTHLVVVAEVKRNFANKVSENELRQAINAAVVQEHGLSPSEVVFIRAGNLPKTTSGKIRRKHTKSLWLDQQLELVVFNPKKEEGVSC